MRHSFRKYLHKKGLLFNVTDTPEGVLYFGLIEVQPSVNVGVGMLIFEADHKLLCEIVFSDIAYHAGEDFREQILELLNKVNLEYKSYYKLCIEKDGFVVLQTTVHFSSFGAVNRALCDGVKALAALYPEINDQVQRIEESNELS